jgi:hypothetical protein
MFAVVTLDGCTDIMFWSGLMSKYRVFIPAVRSSEIEKRHITLDQY